MLRLSGGSFVISRPSTAIAPRSTGTKPQIALKSVVLPQPDEPSRAMNSPPRADSDTRFSTWSVP